MYSSVLGQNRSIENYFFYVLLSLTFFRSVPRTNLYHRNLDFREIFTNSTAFTGKQKREVNLVNEEFASLRNYLTFQKLKVFN